MGGTWIQRALLYTVTREMRPLGSHTIAATLRVLTQRVVAVTSIFTSFQLAEQSQNRKYILTLSLVYVCTLGGIASICFRFHLQQTLRIQIQGSQGCQKIRKIVRNPNLLIARLTIHPSLVSLNPTRWRWI